MRNQQIKSGEILDTLSKKLSGEVRNQQYWSGEILDTLSKKLSGEILDTGNPSEEAQRPLNEAIRVAQPLVN